MANRLTHKTVALPSRERAAQVDQRIQVGVRGRFARPFHEVAPSPNRDSLNDLHALSREGSGTALHRGRKCYYSNIF